MKSSTSTPTSMNIPSNVAGNVFAVVDISSAAIALESNNIQQVVKGVNYLLQKSFDANQDQQTSAVVQIENYPRLMHALSDLLDILNPAAALIESEMDSTTTYHMILQQEIDGYCWPTKLVGADNDEIKFMTKYLDENPLYLSILATIRNLSFEMINENVLALNVTILKHIVCILAGAAIHAVSTDATQMAFDIALNLAHRIDFTGRKRNFNSTSFFQDESKDSLRFSVSRHMSNSGTVLYMQLSRTLVYTLYHLMLEDNFISKYFVGRSLELIGRLLSSNEKDPFFRNASSPHLIKQLSSFLAVSTTRAEVDLIPDGLAVTAGDPYGRSRPYIAALPPSVHNMILGNNSIPSLLIPVGPNVNTPLRPPEMNFYKKLIPATYLTSDNIDFELRDIAIDCLLVLCRNSQTNAEHLYGMPRVVDLLLRIAKMPSNPGAIGIANGANVPSYRTEGNTKAAALLATIMGPKEHVGNASRLKRMRTTLLYYTTCDENISDVTCNKVHPSFLSGIVEKQSSDNIVDQAVPISY